MLGASTPGTWYASLVIHFYGRLSPAWAVPAYDHEAGGRAPRPNQRGPSAATQTLLSSKTEIARGPHLCFPHPQRLRSNPSRHPLRPPATQVEMLSQILHSVATCWVTVESPDKNVTEMAWKPWLTKRTSEESIVANCKNKFEKIS